MVSFASKKLGADIETNNCTSFELVEGPRSSMYAEILLRIASKAGYIASSLPLLVVNKVCID